LLNPLQSGGVHIRPDMTTPAPVIVRADDDNNAPFENGGIGLVIVESALSTDQVNVQPLRFNSKPA
jgi:hypothetical protein